MYLSQLKLKVNQVAIDWVHNPYWVHQRLAAACEGDPRILFRIEKVSGGPRIIVQSHFAPNWNSAFGDLPILREVPESRIFEPVLRDQTHYRFKLLANPIVKRNGSRLGLLEIEHQEVWLKRKLAEVGAEPVVLNVMPQGFQKSTKKIGDDGNVQTHLAVLFEGVLLVRDPVLLTRALASGIGPAKGYGFGLLSLAAMPS